MIEIKGRLKVFFYGVITSVSCIFLTILGNVIGFFEFINWDYHTWIEDNRPLSTQIIILFMLLISFGIILFLFIIYSGKLQKEIKSIRNEESKKFIKRDAVVKILNGLDIIKGSLLGIYENNGICTDVEKLNFNFCKLEYDEASKIIKQPLIKYIKDNNIPLKNFYPNLGGREYHGTPLDYIYNFESVEELFTALGDDNNIRIEVYKSIGNRTEIEKKLRQLKRLITDFKDSII